MATYSLDRYVTAENARWYTYQLDGNKKNFLPIIVFDTDIEYNQSDTYTMTALNFDIPTIFDLPTCHQVDFAPATGSSTYQYTNVFAYQLKNKYLTMQATSDLTLGIQFVWKDLKGDIFATYQNNYPSPSRIFCNCYYVGLIQFSNGILQVCSDINSTTSSDTIKTDIEKGSGDLASDIKGTMQTNVLHFSRTYLYKDKGTTEFWNTILNDSTEYNPNNPYRGGDEPNNPGYGTFDYSSDVIHVPGLPTTSVVDSGLVSLYAPTPAELQALGNYLWSDAFSVDTFKKMFNNPMDCILGLSLIPVKVPTGGSKEITVGNIVSTVSCTVCTSQYVEVDCGTFTFNRSNFTGSFLDYSPYLKCFLFLPFIGMNEIDMDEWQNSTMGVVYHVDVLTGAMFCFVTRNGSVIMTYSGQCSENVPLSSNDFTTTIGSILGVASTAVGAVATVATAGAAAPAAAAAGGLSEAALGARTGASLAGAGVSTASQVGSMKPSIRHSGCVGGGAGIMGVKAPYLLFIAPRMATPNDQEKYTGFSSNKIVKLSDCSGYTEIQAINLHIKNANDLELAEIENGLKTGVIL